MRIVSGTYRGRRLIVPQNNAIRPTSDKVRGAVFNMLHARGAVEGVRVLDAFCGSGGLGLEALSRGAGHATFFDKAHMSLNVAKENASALGVLGQCDFKLQDCLKIPKRSPVDNMYGLVFLDPPYGQGLVERALFVLHQQDWLSDDALVVCETEKDAPRAVGVNFSGIIEKTYGAIKIRLLRYRAGIEQDKKCTAENNAIDREDGEG